MVLRATGPWSMTACSTALALAVWRLSSVRLMSSRRSRTAVVMIQSSS
jgi:hypothetical protein